MRSTISKLLICLLVGGALSVLVAVACTVVAASQRPAVLEYRVDEVYAWGVPPAQHWPATPLSRAEHASLGYREDNWWAHTPMWQSPGSSYEMSVVSAGWPFLMLRGWHTTEYKTDRTVQARLPTDLTQQHLYVLPLRGSLAKFPMLPIWGGLLANVAAYAFVCFGIWFGALELRRMTRIKSQRCVACGYDVSRSTAMCPECGAGLRAAK